MTQPSLLRTALAATHEALGAKMVPFSGWLMPLQYEGLVAEHLHTRASAGLFDLSHMGRLTITGPDAETLAQRATTNDVTRLDLGAAQYSLICNDDGRVVEDLLVYRFPDAWRLIVNASNRTRVIGILNELAARQEFDATIGDETFDLALIGIQGPASEAALQPLVREPLNDLRYYHAQQCSLTGDGDAIISRTGYTGEDGFELVVAAEAAPLVWNRLLEDGRVRPVGLGARDTLRLEAGMALYGHELTEDINPFEANLGRVVRLEKGAFTGSEALAALKQEGSERKLVGLTFEPGAVPRAECPVNRNGSPVGVVASGTFSPTLRHPIATAFVEQDSADVGTELTVAIRSTEAPAQVVSLPFVPHNTKSPRA
jgi:aminomethyltransferase